MSIIDRYVSAYAEAQAAFKAGIEDDIWLCEPFSCGVHIHAGIEKLAESVGAEIKTESVNSAEFPIEKSFTYHGVKFLQLGAESVETEAHNG